MVGVVVKVAVSAVGLTTIDLNNGINSTWCFPADLGTTAVDGIDILVEIFETEEWWWLVARWLISCGITPAITAAPL